MEEDWKDQIKPVSEAVICERLVPETTVCHLLY